ncbi:MAG TPA: hypothetical protein VET65_00635 [Candidatus Limnocylindrales bacterium]|nr:hypothetical protein [Candidatus Limnocylindrales bacterium]
MAKTPPNGARQVDWFAAGLGLVLAVVAQLIGGTLFFGGHRTDAFGSGLLTFGALLLGGFLAGYLGPDSASIWNGIVVAIAFIVIAQAVGSVGPIGTGDLGTAGLVLDDVLVLGGGTLGGWLARSARRLTAR